MPRETKQQAGRGMGRRMHALGVLVVLPTALSGETIIPAAAATSQASKKKKGASGSKRAIASGASDDAENVAQKGGISSSPGKKARKMLKYKFQKGFTNAIRRPVLMSDLM